MVLLGVAGLAVLLQHAVQNVHQQPDIRAGVSFAGRRSASASPRDASTGLRFISATARRSPCSAMSSPDWPVTGETGNFGLARQGRPGDRAAWPATASVTRSPPTGGAGDLAAPSRHASRRLPGGRPPRPGVPGRGYALRAPGPAREKVCMAALRAALHKQDGEPMRL